MATRRELNTAERLAEVLNWRIIAEPNRRAQAARRRSALSSGTQLLSNTPQPVSMAVSKPPAEADDVDNDRACSMTADQDAALELISDAPFRAMWSRRMARARA